MYCENMRIAEKFALGKSVNFSYILQVLQAHSTLGIYFTFLQRKTRHKL